MTLAPSIQIEGLGATTLDLRPTDAMRFGGLLWMLAADAAADEALVLTLTDIGTPLDGVAEILVLFRDRRNTIREERR